jgi:transcriptional antiterminator NusG
MTGTRAFSKVDSHPWYAVRVRSHFEFTTARALCAKGYAEFVPSYPSKRAWSDRVKEINIPLFPGYVFCRFDATDPYPVLNSPGVVHIVSAGNRPLEVEEDEIAHIQAICHSGLGVQPCQFLQAGRRVLIGRGPLKGVEGIVLEIKTSCRIVVCITLLQRSLSAEIDLDWIKPLN